MDSTWLGLSPGARSTRVLAMRGPSETILKAHLSPQPASARAVTVLLEAVALWEGLPVRAALAAAGSSTSSCGGTLYRELLEVFGWADEVVGRRRRDGLSGMADFGDLARLLARTVAR